MGKENNPYLKEIREKVHNVFEALDKTLKEDNNISFETFNVNGLIIMLVVYTLILSV